MTHVKDPGPPRRTPTLRTSDAEHGKPAQVASGRVAFNDRGDAIWEMRTADQRYVRDGSTTLVRKLVPPLSLETTGILRKDAPVTTPKAGSSLPKPAVPVDVGNACAKGQMGTVKTFPVRKATAAKAVPRTGAQSASRPSLIDRLFRRKP